jgi:hypothetical protein
VLVCAQLGLDTLEMGVYASSGIPQPRQQGNGGNGGGAQWDNAVWATLDALARGMAPVAPLAAAMQPKPPNSCEA